MPQFYVQGVFPMSVSSQAESTGTTSTHQRIQTALGIDIGGTKISSGIVHSLKGLSQFQEAPTPKEQGPFIETLAEMAQTLMSKVNSSQEELMGVGIATAGIVDPYQGAILGATGNLPAVQGIAGKLKSILEDRIGLPVYIENDANAAAYGECQHGAAKGKKHVLMVTLGTGVGTGIVIDGKMLHGAHFCAGEGGHIFIAQHEDRKCTCGRWNCWEAYASGSGFTQTARETIKALEDKTLAKAIAGESNVENNTDWDSITSHQVIAAWKTGDPLAQSILDVWHEHVALGIGALCNVLDPEVVIIGGGMAQFVNFEKLTQRVSALSMPPVSLLPAALGNQAGIIGAASLAMAYFGSQTKSSP
jgi:glucokinase